MDPVAAQIHTEVALITKESAVAVAGWLAAGTVAADDLAALARRKPWEWWDTPLGRAVWEAGHSPAHVTYAVAGRLLGVTRQRVGQLVADGRLAIGPAGGVDARSLRRLLANRAASQTTP